MVEVVGNYLEYYGGRSDEASIGFRAATVAKGAPGDWVAGVNVGLNQYNTGTFSIYNAKGYQYVLNLTTNGAIGIQTATPQATLDVQGYMRLAANSAQPAVCSTANDNAIALTSRHTMCICNGPILTWVSVVDAITSCAW